MKRSTKNLLGYIGYRIISNPLIIALIIAVILLYACIKL